MRPFSLGMPRGAGLARLVARRNTGAEVKWQMPASAGRSVASCDLAFGCGHRPRLSI
jgi:hypothetical protein